MFNEAMQIDLENGLMKMVDQGVPCYVTLFHSKRVMPTEYYSVPATCSRQPRSSLI